MLTGAEDIIVLSRPFSISCTTSHKTCQQLPYNKRHPILGCLLTRDPWVLPAKPDIPPMAAPPEASYRRPEDIIVLFSLTQDTMHYFTRNMPQTLQQKAPLTGCLLGKIHGFCPPNRTYPPWPHLRYPLTSKDEDPNKKILARQSCSRAQRTLLFYLLYNNTTQKTDITS